MGSLFAALLLALGLAHDPHGGPAQSSLPACVAVKAESRYVPYGYNHVVTVTNGCTKAATCSVATDVNPKATSVELASGKGAEVLTFAGSPASTFTPRVSCTLR